MVHLIVNLIGTKNTQRVIKNTEIIWMHLWWRFWRRSPFKSMEGAEQMAPPISRWVASSGLPRSWTEQKTTEEEAVFLSA